MQNNDDKRSNAIGLGVMPGSQSDTEINDSRKIPGIYKTAAKIDAENIETHTVIGIISKHKKK